MLSLTLVTLRETFPFTNDKRDTDFGGTGQIGIFSPCLYELFHQQQPSEMMHFEKETCIGLIERAYCCKIMNYRKKGINQIHIKAFNTEKLLEQ